MTKRKVISLLLSAAVSAVLIGFLLTKIDIKDFFQMLTNLSYSWLIGFMLVALTASVLRAWRYKLLLRPHQVGNKEIFLVTLIHNVFVDLLPARIGSLSYVYLVNKSLKISFESAASSFVAAFVLDFLTLSPFLVLAIIVVGLGSSMSSFMPLLISAALFFILILIIFWKIVPVIRFCGRVLQYCLKLIRLHKKKLSITISEKIHLTLKSLEEIKERRIQWPLFFLSLAIRLAKYVSLYFLLWAVINNRPDRPADVSFFKTILGVNGAELTSALPIKGIGGFGTWETAWGFTFHLLGFKENLAYLSGIGVHLITNSFEYILGIAAIIILSVTTVKKAQKNRD